MHRSQSLRVCAHRQIQMTQDRARDGDRETGCQTVWRDSQTHPDANTTLGGNLMLLVVIDRCHAKIIMDRVGAVPVLLDRTWRSDPACYVVWRRFGQFQRYLAQFIVCYSVF